MLSGAPWWLWSGYVDQVRAVAPTVLVGREAEVGELAEWCLGDELAVVWLGGVCGDVTGLLAWFALHPPEGTWVVSYFGGESAGWGMREALVDQLSAIVGPPQSELDSDRDRQLPQLLEWAVGLAGYADRRLVLVLVDSGDLEVSQASWIPGKVRPDLRVVVADREGAAADANAGGELDQLVEVALDMERDDRLLDLPGGPAAILASVCEAQDALGWESEPDLGVALRLSVRRAGLRDRPVSVRLASVWAVLGNVARGHSLARDIEEVGESWQAVIDMARVVGGGGGGDLAEAIARWVDCADGDEGGQYSLNELICGVTPGWDLVWAERVAQSMVDGEERQAALAAVRKAVGERERDREEGTWSRTGGVEWPEIGSRHPGLEELFWSGDHMAAFAEARRLPVTADRIKALAKVAAALDREGDHDHAIEAAALAEGEIGTTDTFVPLYESWPPAVVAQVRAQAADIVARTWAALGERERAEAVVRTITCEPSAGGAHDRRFPFDPFDQAEAMVWVAEKVFRGGGRERAVGLVARAEAVVRADDRLGWRAAALALVAQAWCALGDRARAEEAARAASVPPVPTVEELREGAEIADGVAGAVTVAEAEADARLIGSPRRRVEALANVVRATTDGELRARLAGEAVAVIRAFTDGVGQGFDRASAIVAAVEALVEVGELELAEMVADTVRDPVVRAEPLGIEDRVKALGMIASVRARSGESERAARLAADAEAVARTLTRSDRLAAGLAIVTGAWVASGNYGRAAGLAGEAEQIAKAIEDEHWRGHGLANAIEAMLAIGERERAAALALAVPRPSNLGREGALIAVVEAMVAAGEQERAHRLAHEYTTLHARQKALVAVGDFAGAAEAASRKTEEFEGRSRSLADVVEATARAGWVAEAEVLAQSIEVSMERGRALAAIAEHCGEWVEARRLLVQALAIGGWVEPLSVLARIDPAAARAAIEACG
jgi:hypothetical protein